MTANLILLVGDAGFILILLTWGIGEIKRMRKFMLAIASVQMLAIHDPAKALEMLRQLQKATGS